MLYFKGLIIVYLLGWALCSLKAESLRKKGFDDFGIGECMNPIKWFNFVSGFIFKHLIPEHIFEQMVIRMYDEECRRECYKSSDGKCVECGCDAVAKAYSPLESCSRGNWGKIIFNKTEYRNFREKYPINIKIKHGK